MSAARLRRDLGLDLGPERRPRRPSLTPMIDVVFLLLVFFMLAARFGVEGAVAVAAGGAGAGGWDGPPRIVDIAPDALRLNGAPVAAEALAGRLRPLMPAPDAPVILRPREGASLERALAVAERLRAAGIADLVLAR